MHTFAFTEVKRALFETNGVMYILPRLVGQGRAMQMLLTGEIVLAQDALTAGLVTRVVAQEQLMEYAMDMAHTIAANAPSQCDSSNRRCKRHTTWIWRQSCS